MSLSCHHCKGPHLGIECERRPAGPIGLDVPLWRWSWQPHTNHPICRGCECHFTASSLTDGYCGTGCWNAFQAGRRAAFLACAEEAERRADHADQRYAEAVRAGRRDGAAGAYSSRYAHEGMATWAAKEAGE